MPKRKRLKVHALKTSQGEGIDVFSFFIPGSKIFEVAQISRIHRDDEYNLKGFQRKEIKAHVKRITEFLDKGNALFPNAILLAMTSEVEFKGTRGRKPHDVVQTTENGILEIPIFSEGDPVAWIVDGQQRSMALANSKNSEIPVPVIAFISDDLEVQREQFILVNKARPLPTRLINELLPAVPTVTLPRDLAPRRIPSELCNLLNTDPESPFLNLIKRASTDDDGQGVITDTALINVMRRSIKNPLGALAPHRTAKDGEADIAKMYEAMKTYWTAARSAFPEAWGRPPTESRLMHSAGIEAMGYLMDKIMSRTMGMAEPEKHITETLMAMAPYCRWTDGSWEGLGVKWNEIQNTSKHIRLLADTLVQLDFKIQSA